MAKEGEFADFVIAYTAKQQQQEKGCSYNFNYTRFSVLVKTILGIFGSTVQLKRLNCSNT